MIYNKLDEHCILAQEVKADNGKVEAMKHWSRPKNTKEFKGFFELTRYYKKFIAQYVEVAALLNKLLKKDNF